MAVQFMVQMFAANEIEFFMSDRTSTSTRVWKKEKKSRIREDKADQPYCPL